MQLRLISCFLISTICLSLKSHADTFNVALLKSGLPPYIFTQQERKSGIYVDILKEIEKITGDKFILRYYPIKRSIKAFSAGNIDIEPGINPAWRKEWQSESLYSAPFMMYTDIVAFRRNEYFKVSNVQDLVGKKIATVKGYYYPGFQEGLNSKKITRYNLTHEFQLLQFLSLKQRGADAGFINKNVLLYYMKTKNVKFDMGDVIGNVPIMFRFHKNKAKALPRFNKALKHLIENGKINEIVKRYSE